MPATKRFPHGRWKRVYNGCCKGAKCVKPGDDLGNPGDVFLARCGPPKAKPKLGPNPCFDSCPWTWVTMPAPPHWFKDQDCYDTQHCACATPPDGVALGAKPGDHYQTDCKPKYGDEDDQDTPC
jgi:hypothetical protein